MSDPFSTEYTMDESDVGLDEDGKQFLQPRQEWLKMTKGQCLRGAFVYFHTIDKNAVTKVMAEAAKKSEKLTPEVIRGIARKVLEERAAQLTPVKAVDQLTEMDRLDLSEVKMKKLWGSYQAGLGFVVNRLGKDGPEADAVWKKIAEPKLYFTTLLILYPTDARGDITENEKPRLTTDWRIMPWRFGKKTYENIWKLNAGLKSNGMGIHSQDIKLECKDAQYQNIDVSFVGAAIWQKHEKFRNMVLAKAMPFYDKLIPFREMTTDQLRAKLGMGGSAVSSVGADAASGGDFTDLLDQV
jgi:hypothetical protein